MINMVMKNKKASVYIHWLFLVNGLIGSSWLIASSSELADNRGQEWYAPAAVKKMKRYKVPVLDLSKRLCLMITDGNDDAAIITYIRQLQKARHKLNDLREPAECRFFPPSNDACSLPSIAIRAQREILLRKMVEVKGLSLNELSSVWHATPLHEAVQLPVGISEEYVAILLKASANKVDINARNAMGESPLLLALKLMNERAVVTLIEARADLEIADPDGMTPLSHAVSTGNSAIEKLLLKHGAQRKPRNLS